MCSNQIYRGFSGICFTNLMPRPLKKSSDIATGQGFVVDNEYMARHKTRHILFKKSEKSKFFLPRTLRYCWYRGRSLPVSGTNQKEIAVSLFVPSGTRERLDKQPRRDYRFVVFFFAAQ